MARPSLVHPSFSHRNPDQGGQTALRRAGPVTPQGFKPSIDGDAFFLRHRADFPGDQPAAEADMACFVGRNTAMDRLQQTTVKPVSVVVLNAQPFTFQQQMDGDDGTQRRALPDITAVQRRLEHGFRWRDVAQTFEVVPIDIDMPLFVGDLTFQGFTFGGRVNPILEVPTHRQGSQLPMVELTDRRDIGMAGHPPRRPNGKRPIYGFSIS